MKAVTSNGYCHTSCSYYHNTRLGSPVLMLMYTPQSCVQCATTNQQLIKNKKIVNYLEDLTISNGVS